MNSNVRAVLADANADAATVQGFAQEWAHFDNAALDPAERTAIFDCYFRIFPWSSIGSDARGFDFGCGTGRWAMCMAPRVGKLHCVEATAETLGVARRNLRDFPNCEFTVSTSAKLEFASESMDFGYALGVIHHLPDPQAAIHEFARVLKPNAPLLIYAYYAMDNRPAWYRGLWHASNVLRMVLSRLPYRIRFWVTQLAAALFYWPLARTARVLERLGLQVDAFPLAVYRRNSFYVMRNDALDRFGTRVERRFTATQIESMLRVAGFTNVFFSPEPPFWCVVATKA